MPSVGPAPLSVLDLAPVSSGSTAAQALRNSLDLARHAERLGYHRHWVAEHHNMPGIASSSPPVLIAHIASVTETIRVGSGGVMLPNHQPLVVAEQFGMLEALHPGRIDLGIGRAPGTDQITAHALRRNMDPSADDLPQQLGELLAYFEGRSPRVRAVPGEGYKPAIWLLGSSGFSAQLAGELGLPFSFAHHFMPQNTLAALDIYRRAFRPSATLEAPYAKIGVAVVCAEDDERARWLASPGGLSFLRLRSGRPSTFPSPEEAAEAARSFSESERAFVERWGSSHVIGSPETVRAKLEELRERTKADELMITTMVHDHADRLRSYELVAEAVGGGAERAAA
ncbi:MAG TPA: LLM class flavin-dependent oxidoreductase [Capillimicrobium sp.]|nr:LLM class flavin-dependent oxidoreductase [Capillimicrobium sp.]